MKKIKTNNITTVAALPFAGPTLDFLQNSSKEMFELIVANIVGPSYDSANIYALQGCNDLGTGLAHNIQDGLIIHGGSLYRLDAVSFTSVGADVPVCTITTGYLAGTDPTTFTDLNSYNVHEDKYITVTSAGAGSANFDYSDIIFLQGYASLTLNANYFAYAAHGALVRVSLDKNVVTFSGSIQTNGSSATGQVITTLKEMFRPKYNDRYIYTQIDMLGAAAATACLKIATNGQVTVFSVDTAVWNGGTVIALEGVSFLKYNA